MAHRGYAARFPENSLSAFQAAVDCGCQYLELDVQLSKDKVPIVIHDDNLQRTGSQKQDLKLFEQPWKVLQKHCIGEPDRFGDTFAQEKLLSLVAFGEWLRQYPQVKAFVEIKEESINYFGNKLVADKVSDVLEPIRQQCILISFDAPFLLHVKKHLPYRIGYVLHEYNDASRQIAEQMQPEYLICNYKKIPDRDGVLWQGSWEWFLYEITDPGKACLWLERGASYIETMAIEPMITALADAC